MMVEFKLGTDGFLAKSAKHKKLTLFGTKVSDFKELCKISILTKKQGGSMGGSMSSSIGDSISGQMGGQIGGQICLTDRQKDIIDLLKQNSKISRKAISKILDIAESATQKHLESLKNKGAIKRVGGTRGWWEVLI